MAVGLFHVPTLDRMGWGGSGIRRDGREAGQGGAPVVAPALAAQRLAPTRLFIPTITCRPSAVACDQYGVPKRAGALVAGAYGLIWLPGKHPVRPEAARRGSTRVCL